MRLARTWFAPRSVAHAHAWLGSTGDANGNGATPEEAVADLREAVQMVLDEDSVPEQLTQTLDLGRVMPPVPAVRGDHLVSALDALRAAGCEHHRR